MDYSKNIRRLREERGLSQAELAKRIGVSAAIICGWERGNKALSVVNLCCLADSLHVSTDEILGRRVVI